MNRPLNPAPLCASALRAPVSAHAAGIRLYADDNFRGRMLLLRDTVDDLSRMHSNDAVTSIKAASGRWQGRADAHDGSRCGTLEPGIDTLDALDDRIASLRRLR